MVTRDTAWPAGTPCWVDLAVADIDAAVAFYSGLFGWRIDVGPVAAARYSNCTVDGRTVAGIVLRQRDDQPIVWTTYLATDDADATAAKVTAAGGTVLLEPFDVLDVGRMAVVADSAGAVFGLWQARSHTGFTVANELATLTWNEVMSGDPGATRRFYADVFGHTFGDAPDDPAYPEYTFFAVDGRPVGGVGIAPEGTPAHWMLYFLVADCAAAAAKVTELGGRVHTPPHDTQYGRIATVADPQGGVFSIIEDTDD